MSKQAKVPSKHATRQKRVNKHRVAKKSEDMSNGISDITKFIVLLVFCGSFLILSAGLAFRAKRNTEQAQLAATKTTAGTVQVQFNKVTYDLAGKPGVWVPDPNEKFAVVELTVTNNGTDTLHFSPINTLYIEDAKGNKYEVTSAPNITEGLGGPIATQQTATGQVGFLVPKDGNYTLHYRHNSQQHVFDLPGDTSPDN